MHEEEQSLGKPVLVMRDTTERPEGVEAGSVKLVGTSSSAIIDAFENLMSQQDLYYAMSHVKNPYGEGTASSQIIAALLK